MLSREAQSIYQFHSLRFDPGLEHMIYHTLADHTNHYTTDVVGMIDRQAKDLNLIKYNTFHHHISIVRVNKI
jgi:hypothetical protein